jgi:WD40 repeat protein
VTRAVTAIEALRRRNPDAVRLAQAVSFAVVVDRALLRAARIAFVPEADAGAEADLWFSNVVKSRSVDGIVFDRETAEDLRGRMNGDEVERVWALMEKEHEWLAPSLRIEEEIAYLSVSRLPDAQDKLTRRLQSVMRAMLRNDRPGLAQWASRALTMFPSSVRALEETRMLEAGARLRLGQGVDPAYEEALPPWMALVAPSSMPHVDLHLELRERELVLFAPEEPQSPAARMKKILVPDTKPIVLEVSWSAGDVTQARQVVLRAGETVRLDVGSDEVLIRTIAGDVFQIGETGASSPELASEVIDFSAELARHTRLVGRERELEVLLGAQGITAIVAEGGVGKTALLCELVRRLTSATPVFVHFFRSGNYRMGSISAAARSLAAQIALAYRLDAAVIGLPLSGVLGRLALSPRCPSRLAIVLDAVDEARDDNRDVPNDPLRDLFGGAELPSFVTVYAASRRTLTALAVRQQIELVANVTVVAEVHGPEMAQQSGGNFAEAEALAALRSVPWDTLPSLELEAPLSIIDFPQLGVLAVARWPLPAAIFGDFGAAEPLLRRDGESVALLNEAVRKMALDGLSDHAATHRELLDLLERNRSREDVRRYYALHAVEHLIAAGDLTGARDLCLDLTFIGEVLLFYEPELMSAHLRRVLPSTSGDELLDAARVAFDRERDAMAESPDDVEAILHAYLPDRALPDSTSRLLPMDEPQSTDWVPPRRHDGPVTGVAETTNGPVSWAADGRVMFWPDRAAKPPVTVDHGTAVTCLAEGAGCFVFGDEAGFLHAVHVNAKGNAKVFASVAAHADPVSGVIGAEGSPLVATWSDEGIIRLWSVVQPEGPIDAVGELSGHEDAIVACHFAGGDRLLVSASHDGTLRVWSIADRRAIHVVRGEAPVRALVVSSDSRWLAAGDAAGNLRLAGIEPRRNELAEMAVRTRHAKGIAGIARASSDYLAAVWGTEGDGVSIWRMPMGSEWQPPSEVGFIQPPPGASVAACAIVRNGINALISWTDGSAVLVDLEGYEQQTLDTGGAVIRSIADGSQAFLTGDDRGRLIEWSSLRAEPADYSKPAGRVDALAAGEMVLVSDGEKEVHFQDSDQGLPWRRPHLTSNGDSAVIWSAVDGRAAHADLSSGELRRLSETELPITACAIQDAQNIAFGHRDGSISIRSGERDIPVGRMPSEIAALTFVHDGTVLVSAAKNGGLATWYVRGKPEPVANLKDEPPVVAIEAATIKGRVATMGVDGVISIRRIEGLQTITRFGGHLDTSLGCRFGREDRTLIAAGLDHSIRMFDASSGIDLAGRGHRAPITGLAVVDDTVFSCSEDRTLRMWDLDADLLAVAYGPSAFRSMTVRGEDILAGTDGGQVLTFDRAADIGTWTILTAGEDLELAQKMSLDFARRGVRSTVRAVAAYDRPGDTIPDSLREVVRGASGAIVVMSAAAMANDALLQDVDAFERAGKRVVTIVADDTDAFESERAYTLSNRVDLRQWHDPYDYANALSDVLQRMKQREPVRK